MSMAGGWVDIVSDLICILASVCVCFAYSSNLQLCNILMNLLLLLLKDVGLHYNQNLETTKKTRLFSECLVWSSCLVLFSFLHLFFAFVGLTSRKHNNSRCLGVSWTRDTGPCIIHFCIHMDNLYIYASVYIHTYIQAGRPTDRQMDNYLIRLLDRWLDRSSTYYCCTYIYIILI